MPPVRIDPAFTKGARKLFANHPEKRKRVEKTIGLLVKNPRHPSLATKKYDESAGIWQSYVEQNTPSAWRIWWRWEGDTIVVISFGPHP